MASTLLVFLGAGLGGMLRYAVNLAAARYAVTFPWGTLTVNVVGSFLMGMLAGVLLRHGGNEPLRLLLGTGVLGGFTTFSAFSLDLAGLLDRGAFGSAFLYALASVLISLAALYAGLAASRIG